MINSVELFASVKIAKPNGSSQKSDFPNSSSSKTNSFGDSLREAARNINRADNSSIRKDMASRAEAKLKKADGQKPAAEEIAGPEQEQKEKQTEKISDRIEEILLALQELANMQQNGEMTQENQAQLSEGIKAAFQELTALQNKLAKLAETNAGTEAQGLQQAIGELKTLLEGIMEGLKTGDSAGDKVNSSNFLKKLEAVIEETVPKLENLRNIETENNKVQTTGVNPAAKADMKEDKPLEAGRQEKSEAKTAEGGQKLESAEGRKVEGKAEAEGAESKTLGKAAGTEASEGDTAEEVKVALDGKTEKVTVESKENRKQDTESGTGKEASTEGNTAAAVKSNKPASQDLTAVNQGQTVIEDNSKVIANQVEAPKTQTVNRAEIINQIVKKAEIVLTDAQSEMRMQLEPENLGKLTLRIAVERGIITAKFTAESYEVKQVIESSFNELKDMLQEKGLEIQNFSVSVGQDNKEYNNGNAFQQWKETVRLNGSGRNKGSYEGYMSTEADSRRAVNPYIVHNGEFDHIA